MATASKNSFRPSVEMLEDRLVPTITYHGGALLPHVQAENLYLGSKWNQSGGIQSAKYLQGFTSTLVNSSYMDALTRAGYGVGRGSTWAGSILNYNLNQWVTDGQIRYGIQQAINNGHAAQPGSNSLYVVFVQPGTAVQAADGETSVRDFAGYHSFFVGRDAAGHQRYIVYAVIAYPGGINGAPQKYGYSNEAAQLTDVASHEIAEAVTDPLSNGWYDNRWGLGGEIGDITNSYHQYFGGYYVQLVANQQDAPMRVSSGTVYYRGQPMAGSSLDAKPATTPLSAPSPSAPAALDHLFSRLREHWFDEGFWT